ncbi:MULTISPECIES: HAD hydrolase family protein [unclassified Pandoraea]|uniref:HAD hydrolase family protein n=1 Tax=unclassified Pandoraea TaxID=2624094 RepID=UPI00035CBB27|nr:MULTISPECIES: HAD hydrolase family protein [unclassified Pandoraea]
MLFIDIPGFGELSFEHIVLDFNGTLARNGVVLPGVTPLLQVIARDVLLHVIAGDVYGDLAVRAKDLPVQLVSLHGEEQSDMKADYVRHLGASRVAAIGNGRNDVGMFNASRLSIAVIGHEGAASEAIAAADIVTCLIHSALKLFLYPDRTVATLGTAVSLSPKDCDVLN